ncbi:hypothetical protein BGZ61DRAFT_463857 [Ilyonectria robusta]|uniref:uncharacterized protein n=1 Tax=Ilyonectria robusta TaxID=1079257 RepID=UPI001E8E1AA5|nr:uncharacterized protein BGZ61DRAFT_463857 [Ilyonectria robusta]KAH8661254.1 hypothetical protein BGZ61DRAFT_463857 [Ilyonectria robusta]
MRFPAGAIAGCVDGKCATLTSHRRRRGIPPSPAERPAGSVESWGSPRLQRGPRGPTSKCAGSLHPSTADSVVQCVSPLQTHWA